ncbi:MULTISPECIES: tripartite tricarboxylate transporter substrate binding protein [unclassified Bosea (in: a-proteobacteria)]|uniref:Bug family tripartite tricarboxylate transporter substrate binding protein n=1 Tax=unclassified Bosea (in: a-proteobacteria) TaxID=2653178 RepID=UPI000F758255|nr:MULTISPECIES: tripartite tricarboxylate transporter substrate binding protein [unclassified Bosea (in: a-proteobacteria)]AZO79081.1 Tat pathway signal protein [Bosea sp. Tri-49]
MTITRRHLCSLITAAAASACLPEFAHAQAAFPDRPMKLLVPYAAGGGTDAIARLVAQGVGERLGQSLVVENNGSAGGNLATAQAAAASPDGYTVLMANQGPMVVNPHLFKNVRVDPLTAFDPLTLISAAPLVVVVAAGSPHKTLAELVGQAQKNPGKLTYGSAGNGSASHLATVLLAQTAQFEAVHVPYRGAGPALTDLLAGNSDFMITTVPSALGLIHGGKVRALAVTGTARAKLFPEVPSVSESGWPDYEATAWYGFVVPKGTPKDVAAKLRQATVEAINSPLIRERLQNEGAEPIGNKPEEFAAMMEAESRRWAGIIKQARLAIN